MLKKSERVLICVQTKPQHCWRDIENIYLVSIETEINYSTNVVQVVVETLFRVILKSFVLQAQKKLESYLIKANLEHMPID